MFYSPIIKKVVKLLIFKDQTASKEFRKCFSTTVSYLQFLVSLVYCKSWNFIHIHTELLNRKTKYIPSHFARLYVLSSPKCQEKSCIFLFLCLPLKIIKLSKKIRLFNILSTTMFSLSLGSEKCRALLSLKKNIISFGTLLQFLYYLVNK